MITLSYHATIVLTLLILSVGAQLERIRVQRGRSRREKEEWRQLQERLPKANRN